MNKDREKEKAKIEKAIQKLRNKISENIDEVNKNKIEINKQYKSIQDFTVDDVTATKAIEKMEELRKENISLTTGIETAKNGKRGIKAKEEDLAALLRRP